MGFGVGIGVGLGAGVGYTGILSSCTLGIGRNCGGGGGGGVVIGLGVVNLVLTMCIQMRRDQPRAEMGGSTGATPVT